MLLNLCAVFCLRETDRDDTLRGRLGERGKVYGGVPEREGGGGASHRTFAGDLPCNTVTAKHALHLTATSYQGIIYKGASRRAALAARRFARRLHAMSSAVVVFAIYRVVGGD